MKKKKVDKNLRKAQKSGFLSDKSLSIYKSDLEHVLLFLDDKNNIVSLQSLRSNDDKISIILSSMKSLTKEDISKIIQREVFSIIDNYFCYNSNRDFKYQIIDIKI